MKEDQDRFHRDMLHIAVKKCPSTPLNLQFGVLYAPRVPTPPLVAFTAVETAPEEFSVHGYGADGVRVDLFTGSLVDTFYKLAAHLRMDV